MGRVYLLTGEPGVGKTTALKKIVSAVGYDKFGGFYSEEVRNIEGARTGFRLMTFDGVTGIGADVNSTSPVRIGKYGVQVESILKIGVGSIDKAISQKKLVVIDEIGPMQLCVDEFKQAVMDVVKSDYDLLGTVVLRPYPWVDDFKKFDSVQLFELTEHNREMVTENLIKLIKG